MSRIPLFRHTCFRHTTPPSSRVLTKKPFSEMVTQSNGNAEPPSATATSQPTTTVTLSPSYLSQTATPSRHLQDPTSSRKLLVLDLNGTLLLRPKRGKGKAKEEEGVLGPRIRPIHPRPYIPTFREYLSHPKTLSWLDTMVWSSAQPHSVKRMVEKCFYTGSEGSRCLKGLWARDMFHLAPELYGKKTLTVKDLTLIWSKSTFESSPSLVTMLPNSRQSFSHSAETTVLLDDSPRKAQLQPWNHICIKEYGVGIRRADLDVWTSLRHTSRKQKEKKNKEAGVKHGVQEAVVVDVDFTVSEIVPPKVEGRFDETLLAIIGLLETMKHESNVGAWIRNGGLLFGGTNRSETETSGSSMWFDDIDVASGWARKGKDAVHELGIELVDGIHG
ncbi:hypothetical protein E1B28_008358 [Marasmius oreades]|uniref:Mitochondrial import inner membrane translocase subunit TIM50 n=1 Tax=Marasmius oreades TaxID=181124 RepID=A0A9P7UU76_9AGAR|nr:uncharacterized protein E1B28_008358 [Marasmius oreades]KAG7091969.1 hypothetical protein E1B28_008358 [Marasmius oreades]